VDSGVLWALSVIDFDALAFSSTHMGVFGTKGLRELWALGLVGLNAFVHSTASCSRWADGCVIEALGMVELNADRAQAAVLALLAHLRRVGAHFRVSDAGVVGSTEGAIWANDLRVGTLFFSRMDTFVG